MIRITIFSIYIFITTGCYILSLGGAYPAQNVSAAQLKAELKKSSLYFWISACTASNCNDFHTDALLAVDFTIDSASFPERNYRTNSGGPDIFHYKNTQQQEDPETGFYFYKSRYYDPYAGRFMQPDSFTFPGQTGGMNRYMYVHGNPLKYDDPTGHSPWWKSEDSWKTWAGLAIIDSGGIDQAMRNLNGNLNEGLSNLQGNLDDFTRGAGNFMDKFVDFVKTSGFYYTAMPGSTDWAKRFAGQWEGGFPGQNGIRYNDTVGYMALMYHAGGLTPESFAKIAFWGATLGKSEQWTWADQEYLGPGNHDPFSRWNNSRTRNESGFKNRDLKTLALLYFVDKNLKLSMDQALAFALMTKHLGPTPKTRADLASQKHDRAVPGSQFSGGGCGHLQADREYMHAAMDYRIFYGGLDAAVWGMLGMLNYGLLDPFISGIKCRAGW
jgi:RHS repeat-associated protein